MPGKLHTSVLLVRPWLVLLLLLWSCACLYSQPGWVWAKDVYTPASEIANDVAIDPVSGDVYMAGQYNSSLSSFYGTGFTGAVKGAYLSKYGASGSVIWGFDIGVNNTNNAYGVAVDSTGNVYVCGSFSNTTDFVGITGPAVTLTSLGGTDVFLAKYDPSGQLLWVKSGGGASMDEAYSVCVNSAQVFICGYYTGSASFDGLNSVANTAAQNIFIAAFDLSGAINWISDGGSGQASYAHGIAADNSSVFVTGEFKGASLSVYNSSGALSSTLANISSTKTDAFVLSCSLSGGLNWLKGISSSEDEKGSAICSYGNTIYIAGSLKEDTDFPGYVSNPVPYSGSSNDMYVASLLKTDGTTQWVRHENSSDADEVLSVSTDDFGNVYAAGYYKNSISFSGGPTLNAGGGDAEQIFIVSYSAAGGYLWVREAGDNGKDEAHGVASLRLNEVYSCGEYKRTPSFGSTSLTDESGPNIFIAKISCPSILNNVVSAFQTICNGAVPATLNGTFPSGGTAPFTYKWEFSTDGINWNSAPGIFTFQNYSPAALSVTTYFRRIVFSSAACSNSSVSNVVMINVDQAPTLSNAGANQEVCVTTGSVLLNANAPVIGNATWSIISGSAGISDTSSAVSQLLFSTAGIDVLQWTITNGVCPSSSSTVTITVDALPSAAIAGPDQTICAADSSVSMNAANISAGTGNWSLLSGSAVIISTGLPASIITNPGTGNNIFQWEVTNGTCPAVRDTVLIRVDPLPSNAVCVADQQICALPGQVMLYAALPVTGSGAWSAISGTGTIVSPASDSTMVTGIAAGTSKYQWSVSSGVCPVSNDTVLVFTDEMPDAAFAGADQHVCVSSSAAVLNAIVPLTGNGTWTTGSGSGTFTDNTSATSSVTGLAPGTNIFFWTVTNGVCPASSAAVDIFVDALPDSAYAGSNREVCESTPVILLAANTPVTGTGSWSLVSGSAGFANAADAATAVTVTGTGTHVLAWTISNGACPASVSQMNILVDALPTPALAGDDRNICIAQPSVTMNGNVPASGTALWSVVSGQGIIASPGSAATSISGLLPGMNIFQWTISNGACPSSASQVTVTCDPLPDTAFAGADITTDIPFAMLQANTPSTGNGTWYLETANGTLSEVTDPSASVTGLSVGTNILHWEIRSGACPVSSDDVMITVNPLQLPNAFSPNGDGINDMFAPKALHYYENVKFNVFNRWGNLVYSNSEYHDQWKGQNNNGQKLADDTYYYTLEILPEMQYSGFIILKTK